MALSGRDVSPDDSSLYGGILSAEHRMNLPRTVLFGRM